MAAEGGVIRELVARFSLQADDKSVSKVDGIIDNLIGQAKLLAGAFASFQLAKFVQSVIDEADHLADVAERIGTTTQALQGFGYAAELSGSSAETMQQGLKFLTKSITEAAGGSAEATKSFSALGVSFRKSDGSLKNSADLLPEIADALQKIDDPTRRAALSMGVLSRAGQELAPLLSQGSAGLNDMRAELRALGGEFDSEFVEGAHEAADNWTRVQMVFKGLGAAIGKGVLPSILKLQKLFLTFWKEHGPAIRDRLTRAFEAVGAVMEAVGHVIEMLARGFLGLVSAFEDAGAPIQILLTALGAMLALSIGILAPWLLIAAMIALVVEDLYVFATGGESVIGTLIDSLFAFVTEGDTLFHAFIATFLNLLITLRDEGFGGLFAEVGVMIRTAVEYWGEVFSGLWSTLTDGIAQAFQGAWDVVTSSLTSSISKWWGAIKGFATGIKQAFGFGGEGVNVEQTRPSEGAFGFGGEGVNVEQTRPSEGALSNLGSIFGGTVPSSVPFSQGTVAPSLGASSTGSVYAPQTSTQVTVNAAPGMDEQMLTDLMISKIDERAQEHNSAAYSAVIGAAR